VRNDVPNEVRTDKTGTPGNKYPHMA
jgi:hypothetical protein